MKHRFLISWECQHMKSPAATIRSIKERLNIPAGHNINYMQEVSITDENMPEFTKCVDMGYIRIIKRLLK